MLLKYSNVVFLVLTRRGEKDNNSYSNELLLNMASVTAQMLLKINLGRVGIPSSCELDECMGILHMLKLLWSGGSSCYYV